MTGWTIGLIMAAVTGLVLYFQTSASGYSFKLWPNLIMVLPMATVNSMITKVIKQERWILGYSVTLSVWLF
jgi:hypothetical protein